VVLLLLLAFAARTLLASPCRGVADIQDFWRVARPAGIEHAAPLEAPGYYVRCRFVTGRAHLLTAPSSSALLAWFARHLGWAFGAAPGTMDLRQVGALYLFLLAGVVTAGLRAGLSWPLAAALVWVLVDPGYLLFFNSFYADATMILALAAAVVWIERSRPLAAAAAPAIALLGGGSKMQYALFPFVLLAALLPDRLARRRTIARRSLAVGLALAFCGALTTWSFFAGPGPRFPAANNYHAVYGGLMRVASDPERVLRALDVPQRWWDLPRSDVWSSGVGLDHPVHESLARLSRLRLLWLYAADPPAVARVGGQVLAELAKVRSHPRGELERRAEDRGPVARRVTVAWQFSRLSRRTLGLWPPLLLLLPLVGLGWALVEVRRSGWRARPTAIVFLALWSATQIAIAVLGEGLINLQQHLLGARLGLDLLLVVFAAELVAASVPQTLWYGRAAIRSPSSGREAAPGPP